MNKFNINGEDFFICLKGKKKEYFDLLDCDIHYIYILYKGCNIWDIDQSKKDKIMGYKFFDPMLSEELPIKNINELENYVKEKYDIFYFATEKEVNEFIDQNEPDERKKLIKNIGNQKLGDTKIGDLKKLGFPVGPF